MRSAAYLLSYKVRSAAMRLHVPVSQPHALTHRLASPGVCRAAGHRRTTPRSPATAGRMSCRTWAAGGGRWTPSWGPAVPWRPASPLTPMPPTPPPWCESPSSADFTMWWKCCEAQDQHGVPAAYGQAPQRSGVVMWGRLRGSPDMYLAVAAGGRPKVVRQRRTALPAGRCAQLPHARHAPLQGHRCNIRA